MMHGRPSVGEDVVRAFASSWTRAYKTTALQLLSATLDAVRVLQQVPETQYTDGFLGH
jgi:hypothetical protein